MISSAWIWFIVWERALTAECRSLIRIRNDSTSPSPLLGTVSVPASTVSAA